MLLVKLETSHRGLIGRQQVKNIHVEAQTTQAGGHGHQQQHPPPAFQERTHRLSMHVIAFRVTIGTGIVRGN